MWENFGDVNFLEYGGCLVKEHWTEEELASIKNPENMKHCYDVFYLNAECGEDIYAALCCVDLTDEWLDWNGMFYTTGQEEKIGMSLKDLMEESTISPKFWAKEMVEYMGIQNFCPISFKNAQYPEGYDEFILSKDELIEWLHGLGAEEFV